MSNSAKTELKKISLELEKFSKEKQVEICLNLAKLTLSYWENYYDIQEDGLNIFRKESVRKSIEVTEKWLETKENEVLKNAERISNQVCEDMKRVSFFYEEASGNAEIVKNRKKALRSIECAFQTIQCLLWTREKVKNEYLKQSVYDKGELKARQENGAVFETAQAIYSARVVIENDERILKEIIKVIR